MYYTSTYSSSSKGDARQLLWAAEVGAFGARKQDQGYKYQGLVRCVRNLPSETIKEQQSSQTVVGDDALGDVSYDQSKEIMFLILVIVWILVSIALLFNMDRTLRITRNQHWIIWPI